VRLVIDYKKCRRAGQCSYLHPELFKVDEGGAPVVLVEQPDDQLREAAVEAVDLCPNGAISLREDE
jgi:ferredoxin